VDIKEAVAESRCSPHKHPILLTKKATTIAGLLPLAFFASNTWPRCLGRSFPGLLPQAVLTLLVVRGSAGWRLLEAGRSCCAGGASRAEGQAATKRWPVQRR